MEYMPCSVKVIDAVRRECRLLASLGYKVSELVDSSSGAISRGAVIRHITYTVNSLKAQSRLDERVYVSCGRLVHQRIRAREVLWREWLDCTELAVLPCVKNYLLTNVQLVKRTLQSFSCSAYPRLCSLGLQAALKYEEMYLCNLGHGRQESMGQFFLRLSAAAALNTTDAMALAMDCDPGGEHSAFLRYFDMLSQQAFVPSTPLMIFGGRDRGASASCYLLNPEVTSSTAAVEAVVSEVAKILLSRGGIGISLQTFNKRPSASCKHGLTGVLKLLDSLVMSINSDIDRPTGVCVYLEPWHCNVRDVLNMKGMLAPNESERCDNLFSCLWVPDLFMKRYIAHTEGDLNVRWTLFDDRAAHLAALHGPAFEAEYCRLEEAGVGVETVSIQSMVFSIVRSIVMTGNPFIMFKDACNRHYHTDTTGRAIACSNLCTEIIQQAHGGRHGVCNLASVNLPQCVRVGDDDGDVTGDAAAAAATFDFEKLETVVSTAALFVTAMMARDRCPTDSARCGMETTRSLGIGVQGLHTLFLQLGLDMVSPTARDLNKHISERMLLAAMSTSNRLCVSGAAPFPEFCESKFARGWLPFDEYEHVELRYPERWEKLRASVKEHGLYNAQFIALMPTVSSSQVTECSEGFAPVYTNMFSKVTMSGELLRPNLQLLKTLRATSPCETERLTALLTLERGQWSVSALGPLPPSHPLSIFKTAFEYPQEVLIDLCADRAPFVDNSQSMSLFINEPSDGPIPASHVMRLLVHAYKKGLKTGLYYCKISKATNNAVFTGAELVCSACQL